MLERLRDIDVETAFVSAEEAVRDSDIVVTATPSTSPLVLDEWVGDGTHISAMGADGQGKQELDPAIFARAFLFADHPTQAVRIGELQHLSTAEGTGSIERITAIGDVTLGKAAGRESDADITVFDSSGIAIQDLMVARAVLDMAHDAGIDYIDL